jgi:MFS family permease
MTTGSIRRVLAASKRLVLPDGASNDTRVLLSARAVRGFGDGFVSVLLPVRLADLGFSGLSVGAIASATLFGSAIATLASGFLAGRLGVQRLLIVCSAIMVATGIGFATATDFWLLLAIATIGTLNPTAGDVSVFLPVEQSVLPGTAPAKARTAIFARYRMIGSLAAAIGALLAGVPSWFSDLLGVSETTLVAAMFGLYGALGLVVLQRYRGLSVEHAEPKRTPPLGDSRGVVYRLSALFALDSFGSGFLVQSLIALWMEQRYGFSVGTLGFIFFWMGLLTAFSQLLAAPLAARIGLVNTMVFTHLPANIFLMLAPFMPNATLALVMLMGRSLLSSMDAPARSSYVMAVVPEAERAAASSVTNAPRGLANAFSPALAGWMLGLSTFGLPLVIGGGIKVIYDLALWRGFRTLKPEEEE